MATWNSKKVSVLLNKKIRKRPCPFDIVDEETVGLLHIWKGQPPGKDPIVIDNIISTQEKYNFSLLNRIKEVLADYNHKIHVILDEDGKVSIIICKWTHQKSTIFVPTESLEVVRNSTRRK